MGTRTALTWHEDGHGHRHVLSTSIYTGSDTDIGQGLMDRGIDMATGKSRDKEAHAQVHVNCMTELWNRTRTSPLSAKYDTCRTPRVCDPNAAAS